MNRLTIYSCPLCQSDRLRFAMKCVDNYATGEEFELCRCEDCGFLFTQNAPAEAEIARYYETPDYISHSDTKKGVMNKLYHLVRSKMLNRKAALIQQITGQTSGTLLDIGTGTGYFAHTMQRRGWTVAAIEKNPRARQFAKEHFELEVMAQQELDGLPAKSFDVITLWHVMEHLEHLNETWERLHELLVDNGVLVVAVPNCNSYDARRFGARWAAYDVPRHLWHFTPATIQQMGNKHQFALTAHYPMPFDAFYVAMLSEKYKKSFFKFPLITGVYVGIAGALLSLSKRSRSSSLIYVFRKK